MKKLSILVFFLYTSLISLAQIHVGNDTTICFGESVTLTATIDTSSNYQRIYFNSFDTVYKVPISIGFTFKFFGFNYDSVVIGANGWVGFNTEDADTFDPYYIQPIPSTQPNVPKNCIMGPWQDWIPAASQGAYVGYETVGTSPDRKFVVDFFNVPLSGTSYDSLGIFQFVLNESDYSIENHITSKPYSNIGIATQGIHNKFGTMAYAIPGRNGTQWTAIRNSWKYTPIFPAYTDYNVEQIEWDPIIIGKLSGISWWYAYPNYHIADTSTIIVWPGSTTNYIAVTILNGTVPFMDTVTVNVQFLPIANAGNDVIIPQGSSTTLDGTGSSGTGTLFYHWEPSGMVNFPDQPITPTVPLVKTQLYKLAVRDDLGCLSDTDEVVVAVQNSLLFANLTVDKPTVCSGDSVKLQVVAYGGDITVPYTYDWWSDPFSPFILHDSVVDAHPIVTTRFFVRVTNLSEIFVDSITVNVPGVDPHISGDSQVCQFQTGEVYIADSSGNFFNWSIIGLTPPSFIQNNNAITVNWGDTGTYNITVIETTNDQYACTAADTFAVTVFSNPLPVISGTAAVCEGDSALYFTTPYTPGSTYEWNIPNNFGVITDTNSNQVTVQWIKDGNAHLFVIESTPIGCTTMQSFNVLINPLPDPLITGELAVCETDTAVYITPYYPGNVYEWQLTPKGVGEIISQPDSNRIVIHWINPGSAQLLVDEEVTTTGCGSDANVMNITVHPNPDILALSPVLEICDGDSVIVTMKGADEYFWHPETGLQEINDSTWIVKPNDTISYTITGVYRLTGCYDSIKYTLMVKPYPVFELGDDRFLYPGTPIVLHAGWGFDSYLWNTGDTDSVLTITEPGDYWVDVTMYGCSTSDSVFIRIPLAFIPIPNAFTPDDDGINDIFNVVGTLDEVVKFNMQVFSRWGTLIFQTTDVTRGWDGMFNGQPCPADVYIWVITFEEKHNPDHIPVTRKGMVTLLR
ncbi:MAG: gliding motility-associated C-terminal domain-containing protein [Bacteroidetes bacterium]|nr:gliding motility-associated C-terminal domain-containing protein [Bacteroidota bacterium]